MKHYYFILLLFFYFAPISAQVANIIDLHNNDADGLPAPPYAVGADVAVEGIVTCGTGVYSSTNFEVYVQDETAGVNAFLYQSIPAELEEGDRVRISGKIAHYRGLTEVGDITDVQILEHNQQTPAPLILNCSQVEASFLPDQSEPNEGRLIQLNGVQVVSGSNPVFTLQDASGECLLFLDPDVNLEPPNGVFSVIGILKQYDSSEPFTGGYEVSPRYASDFIVGDGPAFVQQPREIKISTTGVVFQWQTKEPATASLFYAQRGEELPASGIEISNAALVQEFEVAGLQPATIYHGLVQAADAAGVRQSKDFVFSTASSESSGDIQVYFNHSVNHDVKWRQAAAGNRDLSDIMIDRINNAAYSIDAAYYSFTHDKIFQALFLAHNRGVSVRFIYEADNYNDKVKWLADAGVPVISDKFGNNDGRGYMHDKFLVIDARNHSSGADDWVVAGSANATFGGAENNAENVVSINDETLAAAYTLEFNEMWGSESESPDAARSRFSARKADNTPHRFNIGGVWVEQYMSPSDATENRIIDAVGTADKGLFFCIYSFTSDGIEKAMKDLYLRDPSFLLRGVFDAAAAHNTGSAYDPMHGQGPGAWGRPADIFTDKVPYLLHHKYLLIDGPFRESHPIVVTGSHNWSYSANSRNDENTLIIHDADIANQYYQEFAARYKEAGGDGDLTVDVEKAQEKPQTFQLAQNYPNPFNGTTVIQVQTTPQLQTGELELRITDVLGRRVRMLHGKKVGVNQVRFKWDGADDFGRAVGSGVYLAALVDGCSSRFIKMTFLR